MRILIVRLSAIGDCVHTVPLLASLRQQLPDAFLAWAIEREGYELLAGHPGVDRFHVYPRHLGDGGPGSWPGAAAALWRFRRELRAGRYDVTLDAQGLTKSGLVCSWSGAPRRIGFGGRDSRELNRLFVNHRLPTRHAVHHVVDRNLGLLRALELEVPEEVSWPMPDYAEEEEEMGRFLDSIGIGATSGRNRFAVVNPGTTWKTKTWSAASFATLAVSMIEECSRPVVVTWGSPRERALAAEICDQHRSIHLAPATNLRQLAALVRRAALFVGNDTGPLHLAVALGVPSVAIFGASDPARNGPYGAPHRAVVTAADLPCRPCRAKRCRRRDLACLTGVTPEQVLRSCRELLG